MSDLLTRLASDKDFAKALQAQAATVRSPGATREDADKLLEMISETPEQLEAMRAAAPGGDPRVMSVTITTITTLTTATTAF